MKTKNNFKNIFQRYIKTEGTDYAYMLSANWGSGKTCYIQKNSWESEDIKSKFKTVYYSLNGISSLNDLQKSINLSILIEYNTVKNDNQFMLKIIENIGGLLKKSKNSVLNFMSNAIFSFGDEILEHSIRSKLSTTILILDDLERISEKIDITDLLGLIHEKYAVKGTKVLFICDESRINNEKESYDTEKEKYIRRTIQFIPDKLIIMQNLLEQMQFYSKTDDNKKKYYLDALCYYYRNNTQPNFRNIKFALDIFEEVY